ncbi:MAG: RraA family protein [Acidobacteriota bacterium]
MRTSRLALPVLLASALAAQTDLDRQGGIQKAAVNPLPYSAEEDAKILALFDGLRVADVTDAMDKIGLPQSGLMEPGIKPLWRGQDFEHRIQGIALTARYVRTNRRVPRTSPEEWDKWSGEWYATIGREQFAPMIRPGTVLVFDAAEDGDSGTIGSNNIMNWKLRGLRGAVTSGGARDTDEITKEAVPIYLARITRGYPPGRNELESVNAPVMCGGVLVRPGDAVVADGDGVIVVPRHHAPEVARYARAILDRDKAARRKLYEKLGLPLDKSVR